MTIKNRCCKTVYKTGGIWRGSQCTRTKNLVERDGNLYCHQHDPVEIERRNEKRRAIWRKDYQERIAKRKQDEREHKAFPLLVKACEEGLAILETDDCLCEDNYECSRCSVIKLQQEALDMAKGKKKDK